MKAIAIDPGKSIGVAYRTDHKWVHSLVASEAELFNLLHTPELEMVIIESFAGAGILNKYSIQTIELIGGIKAVARELGVQFKMQTPQAKLAWMAMAAGYTTREHCQDAVAHLLRYENG